jgi:seryl-tRNA synthetase
MIDIRQLREDPEGVKAALARRGVDPTDLDRILVADTRAREAVGRRDDLRSTVKALSRQVGEAKRAKDDQSAEALAEESRRVGEAERLADLEADSALREARELLLRMANLPAEDAPDGAGPEDNREIRRWPDVPRTYGAHQRVPHWEIGTDLGLLDLERGAKLSGSMFPFYRGVGARLIRALTSFALDAHADAYEEIRPPTLVRTDTMISTGHLPKFADEGYHLERDDLWAIPTAEVPLTSMSRDEIMEEADLPLRLTAATPCFRREAGAAGRDTRGLLRLHEFDKVELFAYATREQSPSVLADILERAEGLLQALDLEYRVLDLCAGDLGNSARRTFDLEVYSPGCDMWLEVSSVSWCGDYQARRANIRYRPTGGGPPQLVETLNGSALAWARIWAALVETGRQEDGSVILPVALAPYLGDHRIIAAR